MSRVAGVPMPLLLYILPIILKNGLLDEVYQHFLLLHVKIRILSCEVSLKDEANVVYAIVC